MIQFEDGADALEAQIQRLEDSMSGAAGMTAALTLADQGFPVHLVERDNKLGGNLRHLRYFASENGDNQLWSPQEYLAETVYKVKKPKRST